eukprot:COSAG02_NODE_8152_length_2689_cov_1.783784_1_plen_177_part_00
MADTSGCGRVDPVVAPPPPPPPGTDELARLWATAVAALRPEQGQTDAQCPDDPDCPPAAAGTSTSAAAGSTDDGGTAAGGDDSEVDEVHLCARLGFGFREALRCGGGRPRPGAAAVLKLLLQLLSPRGGADSDDAATARVLDAISWELFDGLVVHLPVSPTQPHNSRAQYQASPAT